MTHKELMFASLSNLLEESETLLYPIYGTQLQNGQNYFGFFGLTERRFLVALLHRSRKQISWVTAVPLYSIICVKIRKSVIPMQYILKINFIEGNPFKARLSQKVLGIDCQKKNLEGFFAQLKKYST